MKLTNWGNYPVVEADVHAVRCEDDLQRLLGSGTEYIARGLGRCYGDSALNHQVLSLLPLNRLRAFDPASGEITCEAGVSFEELLEVFVPRGWFLPITPGTKFVTVGGAIASDVHGKNHHVAGSFSRHIARMNVLLASGDIATCSPDENSELFWATCGGMGLTGVILDATFRLVPIETAYIRQETVKAENLDDIMRHFEESEGWTYSVAWIDCLAKGSGQGRSILMRGELAGADDLSAQQSAALLAPPGKRKLTIPCNLPALCLNPFSVKAFNALYYGRAQAGVSESIVDFETFFYPLDGIYHWNRIYGRRGFTQYQFVLPKETSRQGLEEILDAIAASGQGSFLAVLKLFGHQEGLLSFPRQGYTLALDFPIQPSLFPLLDRLDELVLAHGGRLYLTKDARMSRETFMQGYDQAERFIELKHRFDPENVFQSLQSKRLGI